MSSPLFACNRSPVQDRGHCSVTCGVHPGRALGSHDGSGGFDAPSSRRRRDAVKGKRVEKSNHLKESPVHGKTGYNSAPLDLASMQLSNPPTSGAGPEIEPILMDAIKRSLGTK
jgi:hypothetical protein